MARRWILALAALALPACAATPGIAQQTQGAAQTAAAEPARARNIILFIGDGMGVSTVTAARIFDGQSRGQTGEENQLSFEAFENVALVKTYTTNSMVPDSAGTATAINTGTKTRSGVLNIGPAAQRKDCAAAQANKLVPLGVLARQRGMGVGIVSTARITHATPAAVFAQSPERDWEADAQLPAEARAQGCTDIAAQLMAFDFDVALGGGTAFFYGKDKGGRRTDPAADLPGEWARRTGGRFVTDAAGMAAAKDAPGPLLGLFSPSHMAYAAEHGPATTEPTLTGMTMAALDRLERSDRGYYLMVEAGRIDHAHHEGKAGLALADTQELARAVAATMARIDPAETLVMVTADHSHVMAIAGYPRRGNPILGLVEGTDARGEPAGKPTLAIDGKPYTVLGYVNGPGAVGIGDRKVPETGIRAVQQAAIPTGYEDGEGATFPVETHAGEDVPLYATGPGAGQVRGVIEQNRIFDVIAAALGWQRP